MAGGSDHPELPSSVVVDAAGAGKRLDLFLRDRLAGVSRGAIRSEIAFGRILVDGKPHAAGRPVREGARIDLSAFRDRRLETIAADGEGELIVVHEEERFLVVEKPPGLAAMPRNGEDTAALACRLVAHYPELADVGGPLEAGLVHRLDNGTSGLLVVARDGDTWEKLREQWKWRRVEKEYFALVKGSLKKTFTILRPIAHHPKSARRMVISDGGRSAESLVRPVRAGGKSSLVSVSIREGRRHQIRVHLAGAGHPVLGDVLYGKGAEEDHVPRLMLHASWLKFRADGVGEFRSFASAPPADFKEVIRKRLGREGEAAAESYLENLSRRG